MRAPSTKKTLSASMPLGPALKRRIRDRIQRPVDARARRRGMTVWLSRSFRYSVPSHMRPSAHTEQESSLAVATFATTGLFLSSRLKCALLSTSRFTPAAACPAIGTARPRRLSAVSSPWWRARNASPLPRAASSGASCRPW